AACYHIADVQVDGFSVGAVDNYSFSTVTGDHTIAASFAVDTYVITASAGDNGAMFPSGAASVNCGDNPTVTVVADAGFHTVDVLVDGVSVGAVPSYTFTNVDANHTIAVTFVTDTYTITA